MRLLLYDKALSVHNPVYFIVLGSKMQSLPLTSDDFSQSIEYDIRETDSIILQYE